LRGCRPVIDGNVLLESDADLAQLEDVREVTRSIVIDSTTLDALGCVEIVGESLQILGNDARTTSTGRSPHRGPSSPSRMGLHDLGACARRPCDRRLPRSPARF